MTPEQIRAVVFDKAKDLAPPGFVVTDDTTLEELRLDSLETIELQVSIEQGVAGVELFELDGVWPRTISIGEIVRRTQNLAGVRSSSERTTFTMVRGVKRVPPVVVRVRNPQTNHSRYYAEMGSRVIFDPSLPEGTENIVGFYREDGSFEETSRLVRWQPEEKPPQKPASVFQRLRALLFGRRS